jgi:predicted Zn-dependent protease
VSRYLLAAFFLAWTLPAQQQQPKPEEPPEEDESFKPKEYTLNPVEAQRNITAGNFYAKKGNYRAAVKRYTEATLWDPGNAPAFLKLAEADERAHDREGARAAYAKYLDLSPDAKNAADIRKKIAQLSGKK